MNASAQASNFECTLYKVSMQTNAMQTQSWHALSRSNQISLHLFQPHKSSAPAQCAAEIACICSAGGTAWQAMIMNEHVHVPGSFMYACIYRFYIDSEH